MLGQWRIVLRQAEDAARAGRFDEALALTTRPEVADHHQTLHLRGRLALELIARAERRGAADDLDGAVEDLGLAERLGAAPDSLAAARLKLADQISGEVRGDLDAGEPGRVVDRIETLNRHKIGGPSLRRTREIAEAWQTALDESRRGEFGRAHDHLDRADRLAAGAASTALAAARRDLEARQKAAAPKVEALYAALEKGAWAEVLNTAEAVLETVPEHPAARQARTRAWQQIAAIAPAAGAIPGRGMRVPQSSPGRRPSLDDVAATNAPASHEVVPIAWRNAEPRPAPVGPARRAEGGLSGRFLLWVDAVGGYLVCLDDELVLGRAGHDSDADVPLMGDLSRKHATVRRDGEGYVLRAHRPTFINGGAVESATLRDGDVIRLGDTVELEFRQPSPVSSTARLTVLSRHRLPLAVDGILFMADTCVIGGSSQSHVVSPRLRDPVVLYRQGSGLWCRAAGGFEVDGGACSARAPLTLRSSVLGDGFSFSLESLESKTT
ncbi:MAG: FHA domain-containing protein [Isosphaeraceae bacterium]